MTAKKSILSQCLQELRFHFCLQSSASAGLREFVSRNYALLKATNPKLLIRVKPFPNEPAVMVGRNHAGIEKRMPVDGKSIDEIPELLVELARSSAA